MARLYEKAKPTADCNPTEFCGEGDQWPDQRDDATSPSRFILELDYYEAANLLWALEHIMNCTEGRIGDLSTGDWNGTVLYPLRNLNVPQPNGNGDIDDQLPERIQDILWDSEDGG